MKRPLLPLKAPQARPRQQQYSEQSRQRRLQSIQAAIHDDEIPFIYAASLTPPFQNPWDSLTHSQAASKAKSNGVSCSISSTSTPSITDDPSTKSSREQQSSTYSSQTNRYSNSDEDILSLETAACRSASSNRRGGHGRHVREDSPSTNLIWNARTPQTIRRLPMTPSKRFNTADALLEDELASPPDRHGSPALLIRRGNSSVVRIGRSPGVRAVKSPSNFQRSLQTQSDSSDDELATGDMNTSKVKTPRKHVAHALQSRDSHAQASGHIGTTLRRRGRSFTRKGSYGIPDILEKESLSGRRLELSNGSLGSSHVTLRTDETDMSSLLAVSQESEESKTQRDSSVASCRRYRRKNKKTSPTATSILHTRFSAYKQSLEVSKDDSPTSNNDEDTGYSPLTQLKNEVHHSCQNSRLPVIRPSNSLEAAPISQVDTLLSDTLPSHGLEEPLEPHEMVVIDVDAIELRIGENTTVMPESSQTWVKEESISDSSRKTVGDAAQFSHIIAQYPVPSEISAEDEYELSQGSETIMLKSPRLSRHVDNLDCSTIERVDCEHSATPDIIHHTSAVERTPSLKSSNTPVLEEPISISVSSTDAGNVFESRQQLLNALVIRSSSIDTPKGEGHLQARRNSADSGVNLPMPAEVRLGGLIEDVTIDLEGMADMSDVVISSPLAEPSMSIPLRRPQRKRKRSAGSGQLLIRNASSSDLGISPSKEPRDLSMHCPVPQDRQSRHKLITLHPEEILSGSHEAEPSSLSFPMYSWPQNDKGQATPIQDEKTAWSSQIAIRSSPRPSPLRKRVKRGSFASVKCEVIANTSNKEAPDNIEVAASQQDIFYTHEPDMEATEDFVIEDTILAETKTTHKVDFIKREVRYAEHLLQPRNLGTDQANVDDLSTHKVSLACDDVISEVGLSTPQKSPINVEVTITSPLEVSQTPREKNTSTAAAGTGASTIFATPKYSTDFCNKTRETETEPCPSGEIPPSCQLELTTKDDTGSPSLANCLQQPQLNSDAKLSTCSQSGPQNGHATALVAISTIAPNITNIDTVYDTAAVTPEPSTPPPRPPKTHSPSRSTPDTILSPSTLSKRIALKEADESNVYDFPDSPDTNAHMLILQHSRKAHSQLKSRSQARTMVPLPQDATDGRLPPSSLHVGATSASSSFVPPETPATTARTRIVDTHVSAATVAAAGEGKQRYRHEGVELTSPWMDEPSSVNLGFGSQKDSLVPQIPGPSQLPTDYSTPTPLEKNPWTMQDTNPASATLPRWHFSSASATQPEGGPDSSASPTSIHTSSRRSTRPATLRNGSRPPSRTASPLARRAHIMDLLPSARSSDAATVQPGDDFVCRSFASFMTPTPRSDRSAMAYSSGGILKNRHTASQTPARIFRRSRKRVTWSPTLGSTAIFTVATGRCRKRQASPPPQAVVGDTEDDGEPTPALLAKHLDAIKKRKSPSDRLLPSASQRVPASQPVDAMALTFLLAENDVIPGSQADTESYSEIFRSNAEAQSNAVEEQDETVADSTDKQAVPDKTAALSAFSMPDDLEDSFMAEAEPDADDVDYVMDNLEDFLGMPFSVDDEIKKQAQLAA
ncbi:hypothetical protein Cpir12675_005200 [Ceratocystis pirilliformis]|uniref:Protamine P1 n=1 Tax=Ceratocystis pirilliformis TaxID=259994 RepID=A0ABR3YS54_9PEZI